MSRCCILLLLDGLGDRAYEGLDGLTPLQAARTPHLDRLAAMGSNGLFWAIRPGLCLPSENAHFAMFGYGQDEFPGRGYLEAAGAGIDFSRQDAALLAHFVGLERRDGRVIVAKHRPPAEREEAEALSRAITPFHTHGRTVRYHPTRGLDGIVTVSGHVSARITDSDPLETDQPVLAVQPWQAAAGGDAPRQTSQTINAYLRWVYGVLADHPLNLRRRREGRAPINGLVTQRAGRWRQVQPFADRWGLSGLSISSGIMYQGLAAFLGMESLAVEDGDDPGADLAERLVIARELSGEYDFIHVHTKAPDAAAHCKDYRNKVAAIESLDRGVGKVIDDLPGEEVVLVVTADHSTPSSGPLVHSGEAVPLTVVGPGIRRDPVRAYDEVSCATGALGTLRGEDFMYLVLNWLDKAKLQGLMDCPVNHPYWPGERKALDLG